VLRSRARLSPRPAIAALAAAVTLAMSGCAGLKIGTTGGSGAGPGAGSARGPGGPGRLTAGRSGSLVTEPAGGFGAVYRLIGRARHSIELTMYELADTTAEHGLARAARRGVRVRVVLDKRFEEEHNMPAYRYLRAHHVKVVWAASRYEFTHQKTLVADRSTAIIMSANLTSKYYATSRDFLVIDKSRPDITAIEKVFSADFAGRAIRPGDGRDLVWSPTDSQRKLLALIASARKSLLVYNEEMADTAIEDALIAAARRGVRVRVCIENSFGDYGSAFRRLARAGIGVCYYSSSHGFYIHAKVVEADNGTRHGKVFIGSENFSSTSLNRNRELGLIISARPVMSSIAATFARDYRNGHHVR
jgi:cardiolipin synthase A/B